MVSVFFNDTATTETYTLSLPDALPILSASAPARTASSAPPRGRRRRPGRRYSDRAALRQKPAGTDAAEGAGSASSDRTSARPTASSTHISLGLFSLQINHQLFHLIVLT